MYCVKCGTNNPEDSAFCVKCGSPLKEEGMEVKVDIPEEKEVVEEKPSKKPTKHTGRNIAICIVSALVVVVGILAFILFNKPSIDLNDYLNVTFKGYNGYGTASSEVNWDKAKEKYEEKTSLNRKIRSVLNHVGLFKDADYNEVFEELSKENYTQLDTSEKLTNDDVITVSWTLDGSEDDSLLCTFKYEDEEVTVKDLDEVSAVDPFEKVEVKFNGFNGEGTAAIESGEDNPFEKYISIDKTTSLSNGDIVTLTFNTEYTKEFEEQFGETPKETSKEVEVKGLYTLVTQKSQISDDFKTQAQSEADKIIQNRADVLKNTSDNIESTWSYIGDYMQFKKPGASYGYPNVYGVVFEITFTSSKGTSTEYGAVEFYSVGVNDEGSNYCDFSNAVGDDGTPIAAAGTSYTFKGYSSISALRQGQIGIGTAYYTSEVDF